MPGTDHIPAAQNHLEAHLQTMQAFFESRDPTPNWSGLGYRRCLAHYYRLLIPPQASILEIGCGDGTLLSLLPNRDITGVDLSSTHLQAARQRLPHGTFHQQAGEQLDLDRTFDVILVSDTFNQAADVQAMLERALAVSHPQTRLIGNLYNGLWRPALGLGRALRLKRADPPSNWLSPSDFQNMLDLTEWELLRREERLLLPLPLGAPGRLLNAWLSPLLPWICLSNFFVARPRRRETNPSISVSVVIPARNEQGNIEAAVRRTPQMGQHTELIFVEGHSSDQTWDEIQRVQAAFPERDIKIMQQSGKGKANAVREAFARAEGDLLMILDADLTMPPEDLPKFYQAVANGHCEFANGVRLVYPMDREAMRFLNMCANKAFGLLFSWLLGQSIKDTLCGTKVLRRSDYQKIEANRAYFGEFDPYGDFDLIFGAARLNLKISDIPIRYRERVYGETNINRWTGGLLLARMCLFAARKLKFV